MKFLVGADPEFFLKRDGVNVSAHGLVPGTKEKPHPLKNGAVQLDGTAVEFNITPAETAGEFVDNINSVLSQIRDMIPKEYEFDFSPSVLYTEKEWGRIPDSCKELGCSPDWNAYTHTDKVPPVLPENLRRMRTGAGHIHVGWTRDANPGDAHHKFDCEVATRMFDSVFHAYAVNWDHDRRRFSLYGERGSYRPKSYGFEYRVLSNAWLKYPVMWPWLFDNVQTVMNNPKPEEVAFGLSIYPDSYTFLNNYFTNVRKIPGFVPFTFAPLKAQQKAA